MKKNRIGLYQTGVITFFLTRCFFISGLIPLLFKVSGIDSLVSIILGTLLGSLLVLLYTNVMKKEKNKNIFEAIDFYFPKVFSIVFKILLIIAMLTLGSFLLYQVSLYINNSYLIDIPLFVIVLTFLLVAYFLAKGNIETIARSSEIIIIIFILLFILSLIGIVPLIEPSRLKPFFSQEWFKIGHSSFIYTLVSTIPLFFLTMIPVESIRSEKKVSKTVFIGYFIASFTIFLTFVWMIGCLGIDLASYYQYPETAILKKVSYFKFIERVEGILSINWLLDVMMVLSFILFSLNKGINTFVKGKKHTILYILCLIILLLTGIKFTIALDKLLLPLSLIFILLPLLLYLQILCTKKRKNDT